MLRNDLQTELVTYISLLLLFYCFSAIWRAFYNKNNAKKTNRNEGDKKDIKSITKKENQTKEGNKKYPTRKRLLQ